VTALIKKLAHVERSLADKLGSASGVRLDTFA